MKKALFYSLFILLIALVITGCEKKVKIVFETNDPTISISTIEVKKDSDINLDEYTKKMVRDGYVFKGWYSDSSFKTLVKEITAENSLTLYAKWAKIYTVEFVTGSGSLVDSQQIEEGKLCEEPNEPTYKEHVFGGWYTSDDYKIKYDFYSQIEDDTKIYALWYGAYVVKFETSGTEVEDLNFVENNEKPINQKTEKVGYDFKGWYKDIEYKEIITSTKTLKDNTTVYAKFEPHKYTINFNRNGGSGTISSLTLNYDDEIALTKNAFTKLGHTFKCWNTNADGTGTSYTDEQLIKNITSDNNATITLYAIFEPITYTIVFNANGNDGEMKALEYVYGDKELKLTDNAFTTTKIEYFQGWATTSEGSVVYSNKALVNTIDISLAVNNVITLYAVWFDGATIVFNTGGGSAVSSITEMIGNPITKPNDPTRTGYTFIGWLDNDELVTEFPETMMVGGKNYVASWEALTYTIKFDSNCEEIEEELSGTMSDQEFTYDTKDDLNQNAFILSNYRFVCWNTKADGTGTSYEDMDEIVNILTEGEITLYAIWEAKMITISVQILDESTKKGVLNQTYTVYSGKNLDTIGNNINDTILGLDLSAYKGKKSFIGFYLDETKKSKLTSTYIYEDNQTLVYTIYAYFAPIVTFDLSEAGIENISYNLDQEADHNAFNLVPNVSEKEGYIYIWEIDDLSDCHETTSAKLHYYLNDAYHLLIANVTQNELPDGSGYKYTLKLNEKEYYSYYVKTGKYKFTTLNNVSVLKQINNFDNKSITSDNTYTTITFGAQTSGYTFVSVTKESNKLIYQFHVDIVASMFSLLGGYQDYSNINFSQTKYINQQSGIYSDNPYQIGSDNIYKLKFNILDNDSVPVVTAAFSKTYTVNLLGETESDSKTLLKQISVTNVEYYDYMKKATIYYSGNGFYEDLNCNNELDTNEQILMYVFDINDDDDDASYDRIKFTAEALDKKFEISINQTNVQDSQTLTLQAKINYGVNVDSHEELAYYYANYKIDESDVNPIINLHSKIIAKIYDDQLNADGSAVDVFEEYDECLMYQQGGTTIDGYSRDGSIYVRAVKSTEIYNNNLTINGNFFVLDGSELPVVALKADGSKQSETQVKSVNGNFMNENSKYAGYYVVSVHNGIFTNYLTYRVSPEQTSYKQYDNSVQYNNMNIIGNTITPVVDYSDTEQAQLEQVRIACRNSGGYLGIMATSCKTITNNVVFDYCNTSLMNRFEQASAIMNDTYIYYSWANGVYCYDNISLEMNNSEIRYCGGACIHYDETHPNRTDGTYDTMEYNSYNSVTGEYEPVSVNIKNRIKIDQKTQMVNWVTGSEIWFQLYDMSSVASMLFTATQQYVYGSTTDGTSGYSTIKSYSNLSKNDVAYTSTFEGSISQDALLFNFAIMVRDTAEPSTDGTPNKYNTLETTFKNNFDSQYDDMITRTTVNGLSFTEYSATNANGISQAILAAASINNNIYAYPVSPYSNMASNSEEIIPSSGIPKNTIAQAMATYQGYTANKATLVGAGLATQDGTFYTESAYAVGLQTHGILQHDNTPTGYGWLEFGLYANLGSSALNASIYTYYYQGK